MRFHCWDFSSVEHILALEFKLHVVNIPVEFYENKLKGEMDLNHSKRQ